MRYCLLVAVSLVAAQDVRVEPNTVPAIERHQAVVTVDRPARYSFSTHSEQGVLMQLVDRMNGVIGSAGSAGIADGRMDLLLDVGTYLMSIEGHERASGNVQIEAMEFEEYEPVLLPQYDVALQQIADLQVKRFWLDIAQNQPFHLEVMGRHLADAVIMVGGDFVVDVPATRSVREAEPGKPMQLIEFHGRLGKGRYQVVCFGGEARPWSVSDAATPLYLRWGVPQLAPNSHRRMVVSPFGHDSWWAPGVSDFVQISRQEKRLTKLTRSAYQPGQSRFEYVRYAAIDKQSRIPSCSDTGALGTGTQWVSVEAEPGSVVDLRVLHRQHQVSLDRDKGDVFIAVHQSEQGVDAMDLTAMISHPDLTEPVRFQGPMVSASQPLRRKINLNGPTSFFLEVVEDGTYTLILNDDDNAMVDFSVVPALVEGSSRQVQPVYVLPGTPVDLIEGLYLVRMRPIRKGIADFTLGLKSKSVSWASVPVGKQNTRLQWSKVHLPPSQRWYTLWVPERDEVAVGLEIRTWPLSVATPLDVFMDGEEVSLDLEFERPTWLSVDGFDGQALWQGMEVEPRTQVNGLGSLVLKGEQTANIWAETAPDWPADLVPLDFGSTLDVLREGKPLFRNYERGERAYFLLQVDEDGLYRLETTGRLASDLIIRTRMNPHIFSASENGIGRNALVQSYHRKGEYLVIAGPRGQSKGRMGLRLQRSELEQGQPLLTDEVARYQLDRDQAVAVPFQIKKKGTYQFQSLGLGKSFATRIEDHDQWPIVLRSDNTLQEVELEPGAYRLISLPFDVESRRLISFSEILPPPTREGKGPHVAHLNTAVKHQWRKGDPDIFQLRVPAQLPVSIHLTKGMKLSGFGPTEFIAVGGILEQVLLEPGEYRIKLERLDEDDFFNYEWRMDTDVLAIDAPKTLDRLPAEVTLSVGDATWARIQSEGRTDIQVKLYNQQGQLVAAQDDAGNDWNIDLPVFLETGTYRLMLTAHGRQNGPVNLSVKPFRTVTVQPESLAFEYVPEEPVDVVEVQLSSDQEAVVQVAGCPGPMSVTSHHGVTRFPLGEAQWLMEAGASITVACPCSDNTDFELKGDVLSFESVAQPSSTLSAGRHRLTSAEPATWIAEQPIGVATESSRGFHRTTTVDLSGGSAWVIADKRIRMNPLRLSDHLSLDVEGLNQVVVLIDASDDDLVVASSPSVDVGAAYGTDISWPDVIVGSLKTWIPARSGQYARFWNTNSDRAWTRLDLRVVKMRSSEQFQALEPGEVARVPMDHGWYELTLPPQVMAAATSKAQSSVQMADHRACQWIPDHPIDQVTLYNLSAQVASPVVLLTNPPAQSIIVDLAQPFEGIGNHVDSVRLPVKGSSDRQLRALGGAQGARFLTHAGAIKPLDQLEIGEHVGGWLDLPPHAGWYLIWEEDTPYQPIFPRPMMTSEHKEPGSWVLSGRLNGWTLDVTEPEMYRFTSDLPLSFGIFRGGVCVHFESGSRLDVAIPLDPATYQINVRLRPGETGGFMEVAHFAALPLDDGVNPKRWLQPSRVHAYELTTTGMKKIGMGAISDGGPITLSLFGTDMRLIEEGAVLIRDLPAGTYHIAVRGGLRPTAYQLALFGRKTETEIPETVVRAFMEDQP